MKKPLIATISKFPPYMSGHSFEAMNQGRALYGITGYKHHEITYSPEVYDKTANFNSSPQLLKQASKYLYVHRVKAKVSAKGKVLDGELTKAMIGKVINLIERKNVNILSTFYIDPHGYIANAAKVYAERVLGRRVLIVQKAVGSDVLSSIGNHLKDGQAKFLLMQLLESDLVFAVSQYTKNKLLEFAKAVLPYEAALRLSKVEVLYAPFDNEYFKFKDEKVINSFRTRFKIKQKMRVISYFGRLFPEKGVEDLIQAYAHVKHDFPETVLIIGGQGIEMPYLKKLTKWLGIKDVKFAGGVSDEEKRAIMQMSYLGVIPTKPIKNFVETLCISALEYQASGTPLLTTKVGGVPEAAGLHSAYFKHSNTDDLALNLRKALSGKLDLESMRLQGLKHVEQFNYFKITKRFLDKVMSKRETKVKSRVTISPSVWLMPEFPVSYGSRRYKV